MRSIQSDKGMKKELLLFSRLILYIVIENEGCEMRAWEKYFLFKCSFNNFHFMTELQFEFLHLSFPSNLYSFIFFFNPEIFCSNTVTSFSYFALESLPVVLILTLKSAFLLLYHLYLIQRRF